MEEVVGEIWHRLITRQASTDVLPARVELAALQPRLATFFRAMGGEPGKRVEAADHRNFRPPRSLTQRLAGSHRRFMVCWQDGCSLRLPADLALFDTAALNEGLYFWLAALAAKLPEVRHWFADNQRATRDLLEHYPGLARLYRELAAATLAKRPQAAGLDAAERRREEAVRRALEAPGSVAALPRARGDLLPVPLWVYPPPLQALSVAAEDSLEEAGDGGGQAASHGGARKRAERLDDGKQTDGLLVFQLESLFSWCEQVELDRCQEEDLDQDLASVAEDLDLISLSRQRRAGSARIKFDLDLPAPRNDDLPLGEGLRLPEWDYRRQRLVADYCLLQPMLADRAVPAPVPENLRARARTLKNRFSLLRPQRSWQRRQPFGDEIDLDAWLESQTRPWRSDDNRDLYRCRNRPERDLACLLLADLSMSTDAGLNRDQRVIDVIRDSMLLFAEALSGSGDAFAMYGFSSLKNKQVRYQMLKNFAEAYGDDARGRILAVKPGFYTRMGAAIRQSSLILQRHRAQQRLLLILSDGKPNDIDCYEGRYGIEDTRRAVLEARQQGLQPFCVTIDDKGNDYLPYLFGSKSYVVVNDLDRLPLLLPKLYLNLTGTSA